MGQKTNPIGLRLGITTESASKWYAGSDYADKLHEDLRARDLIAKILKDAQISKVEIERPAKTTKVIIHTAKPGVIIGQKGRGVESLREKLAETMGTPVHLNIEEVKKPELSAKLVAEQVAKQLEQRVMFRRAMKRAVTGTLRAGAEGVKIFVGGRLGGAEIARSEWYREGRVPLHTLRAEIDYGTAEAHTTFGVIGVKVWIFKGEKIGKGGTSEKEETPKGKKKKSESNK